MDYETNIYFTTNDMNRDGLAT